jgi:large subunit ribosomal protein L10
MKKEEKQQKVDALRQELEDAKTIILSSFEGLKVAADSELRRQVRDSGAHYQVVKNSLIERASKGTGIEQVAAKLRGTTSLAYTAADPVALAKILTNYAKENPALVFKAGVVEGRVVSMEELTAIASLPSREDLLAKALFLIKAPAQQLATSLAGVARNLARVVQQGVKENKFAASAGN